MRLLQGALTPCQPLRLSSPFWPKQAKAKAGAPCSLARRLCTVWARLIEGSLRSMRRDRHHVLGSHVTGHPSALPHHPNHHTRPNHRSSSHVSLPAVDCSNNQRAGWSCHPPVPMPWAAAHEDCLAWKSESSCPRALTVTTSALDT